MNHGVRALLVAQFLTAVGDNAILFALAAMVLQGEQYADAYGEPPKTILLQNHGLIALAPTAQQVENITAMAVKTARILYGTYALGGPRFLTAEDVNRIHTRPDEHYRQRVIGT